jgi:hypothetical protein
MSKSTIKPLVQVVIPQLFAPLNLWQKDFAFQADSLLISSLCRYADCDTIPQQGLEQTLSHLLNPVEHATSFAYYRYQADFGQPPNTTVLCADPAHFQTGIDQIILRPVAWDAICPKNARDLLQRLNQHFSQDGLTFVQSPKEKGHWYVLFDSQSDYYHTVTTLKTTPLSQVLGQNVLHYLPQNYSTNNNKSAEKSLLWHRLLNEIQMLLHLPTLTDSRAVVGDLPINSLWFWGSKEQYSTHDVAKHKLKINGIYGEQRLLPTFALMADCTHHAANDLFVSLIKMKNLAEGQHILVLDTLLLPAIHDQPALWRKALHQIEVNYLRPLHSEWQAKRIDLQLYPCDGRVFRIKGKNFWQHFAKPHSNLQDFSVQ